MIREFCDKCGVELKPKPQIKDKDGDAVWPDWRIMVQVHTRYGPEERNDMEVSTDVLCPPCAEAFRIVLD